MTFSPQLEARFDKLLKSYPPGRQRSAMIPMLLYAQDEIGRITDELVNEVATRIGVTPLQVSEVLSYYSMLHTKPLGKYHVQVCTNISCLLHDGDKLYEHACKKLGIGHKEVTADGEFSITELPYVLYSMRLRNPRLKVLRPTRHQPPERFPSLIKSRFLYRLTERKKRLRAFILLDFRL